MLVIASPAGIVPQIIPIICSVMYASRAPWVLTLEGKLLTIPKYSDTAELIPSGKTHPFRSSLKRRVARAVLLRPLILKAEYGKGDISVSL